MRVWDRIDAASTATVLTAPSINSETLDLLAWVAAQLRTYSETMERWQTSCPRHSTWEDALGDGLVQLAGGGGEPTRVVLTPRGQALHAGR